MLLKKSMLILLILITTTVTAQDRFFSSFSQSVGSELIVNNQLNVSSINNISLMSMPHKLTVSQQEKNPNINTIADLTTQEIATTKRLSENLEMTLLAAKRRRSGMEKTGRILTFIGVPLGIIGGVMVAGADELYYECTNGNCSGDARGGFGVVLLGAGVGLSGTGTVLWILGSKK